LSKSYGFRPIINILNRRKNTRGHSIEGSGSFVKKKAAKMFRFEKQAPRSYCYSDTGSKRARTNTPQDEGTKPKRKALQPRNEDTGTTNSFMGNNKATKINQIGTRFDIEIENLFIIAAINLSEITL
jgi:hypothetical protein